MRGFTAENWDALLRVDSRPLREWRPVRPSIHRQSALWTALIVIIGRQFAVAYTAAALRRLRSALRCPDLLDRNLSAGEGDAGNVLHDGAGELQLDAFPVPLILAPLTLFKLKFRGGGVVFFIANKS
jgi:hypothetical protein